MRVSTNYFGLFRIGLKSKQTSGQPHAIPIFVDKLLGLNSERHDETTNSIKFGLLTKRSKQLVKAPACLRHLTGNNGKTPNECLHPRALPLLNLRQGPRTSGRPILSNRKQRNHTPHTLLTPKPQITAPTHNPNKTNERKPTNSLERNTAQTSSQRI